MKYFNLIPGVIVVISGCAYNSLEDKIDCTVSDLTAEVGIVLDADCGLDNGSITTIGTGGTSPYHFVLNSGPPQSDSKFENLPPSNYTIVIIDASGCTDTTSTVLNNKEGVSASVELSPAGCNDTKGSITVNAFNGAEPYKYKLDGLQEQNERVFNDLAQGPYSILVSDANGCSFTLDETVLSGVSFIQSISPIIMTNCALSTCHGGTQFPDFRVFGNIQSNAKKIKENTQSRFMPLIGSLTQEEIDLIACWVDDGAPEN